MKLTLQRHVLNHKTSKESRCKGLRTESVAKGRYEHFMTKHVSGPAERAHSFTIYIGSNMHVTVWHKLHLRVLTAGA